MRDSFLVICLTLLVTGSASARTWYITSSGSGDAPTIQAGIDSASAGDTVLVACGTYVESDIAMKSGIVVSSETGEADCVVIDAGWAGHAFCCYGCEATTLIKGFTMTHGNPPFPGWGGAVISLDASEQFINCVFTDNAASEGAGAFCQGGSPIFTDCLFSNNLCGAGGALFLDGVAATVTGCAFTGNFSRLGGTIWCSNGSPRLMNCTFYANPAEAGTQIYCYFEGSPMIENTIIAYSSLGTAVRCEDETNSPTLMCCDLYGNAGDWTECIEDQLGMNGNFSADPLLCDPAVGNLRLENCSPCMPGYHPAEYDCGGVIGAFGSGCACGSASAPTSWGAIKAMYQ
jgi:hypothetical protein